MHEMSDKISYCFPYYLCVTNSIGKSWYTAKKNIYTFHLYNISFKIKSYRVDPVSYPLTIQNAK